MDLRRLPELFCGFQRERRRGPTLYPVACAPQAWASADAVLADRGVARARVPPGDAARFACAIRGCRNFSTRSSCAICSSAVQRRPAGEPARRRRLARGARHARQDPGLGHRRHRELRRAWNRGARPRVSPIVPDGEANMRDTFRTLWLIPLGCAVPDGGFLGGGNVRGARAAAPSDRPPRRSSRRRPEPSVTVLGSRQAQSILGKEVRSSADENMGRIVDVIVDREGRVRAAVIDFGGFLGVGSRKIAVDWSALRFDLDGEQARPRHAGADARSGESGARIQGQAAGRRARRGGRLAVAAGLVREAGEVVCRVTTTSDRRPAPRSRARRERDLRCRWCRRRPARASRRIRPPAACAVSTGSSSSSPTCRPASARSSRSI